MVSHSLGSFRLLRHLVRRRGGLRHLEGLWRQLRHRTKLLDAVSVAAGRSELASLGPIRVAAKLRLVESVCGGELIGRVGVPSGT